MARISHKLKNSLEGALAGGGDPATSPLYVFWTFFKTQLSFLVRRRLYLVGQFGWQSLQSLWSQRCTVWLCSR